MRGRALAGAGRGTESRRGLYSRLALGALLCVCSGGWGAGAVSGQPNEDAVYGYIDDHGRMVHAQSLGDIPPRLRPYARRLDARDDSLVTLLGTKLGTGARPVIYRYVTPLGQTRYTNLLASVPPPQRSAAAVDLSRVSLNSEVGRDLDRALEKEHERLVEGPTCQQLRAAAAKPLWRATWDEHGPLVVIGAVFCLLVLVTPTMLRRFGPNWAKALSVSVSVLAAAGLFTYAAVRGSQALSQLKAKAAPCEPGSWNALAKHDHGVVERVQLLQSMHVEQQGLEQIASEGR
jgi:hypothetical protein